MAVLGKSGSVVLVDHDPEVVATDVPEGTKIIWGHTWYCKEDNGSTTNVLLQGHVDLRAGEAGGAVLNLIPFANDPTLNDNDLFIRESDGIVEFVFYDGTTKHVLGSSQFANICALYASAFGAVDEITAGVPENLLKGCTIVDAGELGAHFAVISGGTDTERVQYSGAQTKKFKVVMQVNLTSDESGDVLSVWLYKDVGAGLVQIAASLHKVELVVGADGVTLRVEHIVELDEDDAIGFLIDSDAGTPVLTPRSLVISATPV